MCASSAVFILNKEPGISSFAALGALKRVLGTRKVGHAGTLDPFASGVLIAVSGKMTKAAEILTGMDKKYTAVFRFGEETDTLDSEGQVVSQSVLPDEQTIRDVLSRFKGDILQRPPAFSAVKINGQRAYKRARNGQEIDMPERKVTVHDIQIIQWQPPDLHVAIHCSKGTYIRSIARDLGYASGSRAYCQQLRRDSVGPFLLKDSVESQNCGVHNGIDAVHLFRLLKKPVIQLPESMARKLKRGVPLQNLEELPEFNSDFCLYCNQESKPAALISKVNQKMCYKIVFD